jgi:hypothetical protein
MAAELAARQLSWLATGCAYTKTESLEETPVRFSCLRILVLAIFLTALALPAHADEELVKSGTLSLKGWRVSFIASGSKSEGVLSYKGTKRKFILSGLGIGGYGASKFTATGIAYNMKNADDFTGTYAQLRSGIAVGDEGMEGKTLWMKNNEGVTLKVTWETTGLQLNLGADGLVIRWDE